VWPAAIHTHSACTGLVRGLRALGAARPCSLCPGRWQRTAPGHSLRRCCAPSRTAKRPVKPSATQSTCSLPRRTRWSRGSSRPSRSRQPRPTMPCPWPTGGSRGVHTVRHRIGSSRLCSRRGTCWRARSPRPGRTAYTLRDVRPGLASPHGGLDHPSEQRPGPLRRRPRVADLRRAPSGPWRRTAAGSLCRRLLARVGPVVCRRRASLRARCRAPAPRPGGAQRRGGRPAADRRRTLRASPSAPGPCSLTWRRCGARPTRQAAAAAVAARGRGEPIRAAPACS